MTSRLSGTSHSHAIESEKASFSGRKDELAALTTKRSRSIVVWLRCKLRSVRFDHSSQQVQYVIGLPTTVVESRGWRRAWPSLKSKIWKRARECINISNI